MRFTISKNVSTFKCVGLLIFAILAGSPLAYSQAQAKTIDGENIQDIFCFVTSSGKASELKTFNVKDKFQVPVTEKTKTKGSSHGDSDTKGKNSGNDATTNTVTKEKNDPDLPIISNM